MKLSIFALIISGCAMLHTAQASSDSSQERVQKRELRKERFVAQIDSMVLSRDFRFMPNSMQEIPGGSLQLIYNEFYYLGVLRDHVEVHLPTIRGGLVQYVEILNFDTFNIRGYQASKTKYGWSISFNMTTTSGAEMIYEVNIMVYNTTGQTILSLLTRGNTVRYVGSIQSAANQQ